VTFEGRGENVTDEDRRHSRRELQHHLQPSPESYTQPHSRIPEILEEEKGG